MEEEITIDLRELAHIVQKNARFIAKVTGGCIAVAGLYLLIASPVYESDSLLRIKQPKGIGSSLLESMPMGNAMASKQLMSTYAEILKSRSVIVPVIEQTEEADSDGKYMRYEDYIKNRIVTNPFKDTEILKVTVNANTPEGAQKANDLIVNGFLQRLTSLVREEQKTTRAFIEERVVASKAELEAAESALTEYKKASKILSPTDEMKLAADKMGIVDKLRAENKVALATAQAQLSATDQQLGGEAKATADNAVIKQYNAKLAELETQRIDYLDKYTAKHPKVIETEDAIANLKSKLQQEIAKVASLQAPSDNPVHQQLLTSKFGSEAAISVAESNLAELERLDKRNQEDVERLSEKEQKYLSLMRDVSVADEIYIMLAKRLEEAKVAEVAVSTEVQVVDTATLPEDPVKPSYKFRSMCVDAKQMLEKYLRENPEARMEWERDFKLKNDPRVTPIGEFLRRTSLDELPQIFNVLKGEMSLVGPRPIVQEEVPRYGKHIKKYYSVKPGITGLWQVSGRSDISYSERVALDVEYVVNRNLLKDIQILIKTFDVVFRKKGAY